jgi:hypothetical protein
MYLGREDFDDLEQARQAAISNMPSNITDYLLAKPFLADYLDKGLRLFDKPCDE